MPKVPAKHTARKRIDSGAVADRIVTGGLLSALTDWGIVLQDIGDAGWSDRHERLLVHLRAEYAAELKVQVPSRDALEGLRDAVEHRLPETLREDWRRLSEGDRVFNHAEAQGALLLGIAIGRRTAGRAR